MIKKKKTRVWLQISQYRKKYYITILISLHDSVIILLSFGIQCSFMFGHGWLHRNHLCKTYQKKICPSWRCLRCMMAFAGAFTTKQHLKTWAKTVFIYFTKIIAEQPSLTQYGTTNVPLWKKKMLSSTAIW